VKANIARGSNELEKNYSTLQGGILNYFFAGGIAKLAYFEGGIKTDLP
jgi:hypothetical protein